MKEELFPVLYGLAVSIKTQFLIQCSLPSTPVQRTSDRLSYLLLLCLVICPCFSVSVSSYNITIYIYMVLYNYVTLLLAYACKMTCTLLTKQAAQMQGQTESLFFFPYHAIFPVLQSNKPSLNTFNTLQTSCTGEGLSKPQSPTFSYCSCWKLENVHWLTKARAHFFLSLLLLQLHGDLELSSTFCPKFIHSLFVPFFGTGLQLRYFFLGTKGRDVSILVDKLCFELLG